MIRKYTPIELEHFAAIIENSDDAIVSKDLDGTIRSWNPGAEKIFGYKKDEVIGKNIRLLIPENRIDEEPEIIRQIKAGQRVDHYETIRRRKDGTLINLSLTVSPIKDETGKIVGASKIGRDITLIKEVENKQAVLAAIVESSEDAIIGKDLKGNITTWNPGAEKLFGYMPEEVLGKHGSILFPEDRLSEEHMIMERINKGETVEHFDTQRKTKGGKVLDISLTISPIKDLKGKIIGSSKIARDITERKEAERELEKKTIELERSNKELNDFAYIVSHDLKAPLRAIGTLADFIVKDYREKLGDEGKEYIDLLLGRVKRMNNLIEGVLKYSRVGRTKERKTEVNLNAFINEIINAINIPDNIKIKVDKLPEIIFEKIPLHQIFQNLITNAVKFMDKAEGEIMITAKDLGNFYEFSVSDNGPGIEERHFEKIFQIFQTLQARDEFESTGIGLTIVKKTVEFYGGEIRVSSEPGKGATFHFTLPKYKNR